jgi:hypothetical protein
MTTGRARYQITERLDARAPRPTDPLAQAMGRHSGIFDLRDTRHEDKPVSTTSRNLIALRKHQATLNTADVLG